jgi:hypothetical protein
MMHTLVYCLVSSRKSNASDIFLQQQTWRMQVLETTECFNMTSELIVCSPTEINLTNASTQDSQCFTMEVRVHCFPPQQQNQQIQALKTSYSFNMVVWIQFPPRQEPHEKKIFSHPKKLYPWFSTWQCTPEVIHPLGRQVGPLHQLPLRFRFKMLDPGFIPHDNLWQGTLT